MEELLIFIGNVVLKKQVQPNPCGFIRETTIINKKGYYQKSLLFIQYFINSLKEDNKGGFLCH